MDGIHWQNKEEDKRKEYVNFEDRTIEITEYEQQRENRHSSNLAKTNPEFKAEQP